MEQLIDAFGIDVRLIIIQVFNFGLLMAVLTYFLYKPLLKMLNEREAKIAQGIKDAEEAAKVRGEATEEKKAILSATNKEAEGMVAQAKTFADEKANEIVASAHSKAEQVIRDAGLRSEELKLLARKESEAEIAKLAVLAAEKVLRDRAS
jgi:F-type H+-transporting ATPase subunit b